MAQFDRVVEVLIGDQVSGLRVRNEHGEGLRVAFSVERDTKPWPNNAEVSIWNLNEKSRNRVLGKDGLVCRISAGYGTEDRQIFFGKLGRARLVRDGADIVLRASMNDGAKDKETKTIAKTYAKGTPVSAVLADLVALSGFGPGNLPAVSLLVAFPAGNVLTEPLTLAGPVLDEMEALAKSLGFSWSVQDGAFQFLDLSSRSIPGIGSLISPATGLIGSPTQEFRQEKGDAKKTLVTSGRSLLINSLVPGQIFALKSADFGGVLACRTVKHFGDTHAQEWYTDWSGAEVGVT